ncbi:MAG: DMT family transporter [Candidatus Diapherotrites archaeon]|nr:DMT family transporter [Candidatus Diapherotrites archaeon]
MGLDIGILAAFGAVLAWGLGDFFIQRTVRKIGIVETLMVIGVVGAIGLFPLIYADLQVLFLPENAALLTGLGIITFIAAMLNFYAYKIGKLSVVEVVLEIELPIMVALGLVFFGEALQPFQAILITSIFLGILLVALGSVKVKKEHFLEKGVLAAGSAALFMGLVNFLTASAAKNISPLVAIWGPWVIFTLISILVVWKAKRFNAFWKNIQVHKKLVIVTGVFDTLAWVAFAVTTNYHPLSISIAITESYPAVALVLGLWFNKEKIKGRQFFGAGLALGASILLGFFA